MDLTREKLMSMFHYSPSTGLFTRMDGSRLMNKKHFGKVAGHLRKNGYVAIKVLGKAYPAHRLAYLYMEGYMPEQVDHKNRIRADNTWDNLRAADALINARNHKMQSNNTSGHSCIFQNEYGSYQVRVSSKHIGSYGTLDKAIAVRDAVRNELGIYTDTHGLKG